MLVLHLGVDGQQTRLPLEQGHDLQPGEILAAGEASKDLADQFEVLSGIHSQTQ
jgi:hypothetical protein